MRFWKMILLCLSLFGMTNALASVVYRWETESLSPAIRQAAGEVEIADWAWQAGQGEYSAYATFDPSVPYYRCYSPGNALAPIMRMNFTINYSNDAKIFANLAETSSLYGQSPCIASIVDHRPWFSASFLINIDELIMDVAIHNGNSDLYMNGNSFHFSSDALMNCPSGDCTGATGHWVQVPEPATIALLGVGIFGFVASRRRYRQ